MEVFTLGIRLGEEAEESESHASASERSSVPPPRTTVIDYFRLLGGNGMFK